MNGHWCDFCQTTHLANTQMDITIGKLRANLAAANQRAEKLESVLKHIADPKAPGHINPYDTIDEMMELAREALKGGEE
jgi:hypothetical protein